MDMPIRPRRLRASETLRKMVRETRMDASTLIYPLFFMDGTNRKEEISSLPGQFRFTVDRTAEIMDEISEAGVKSVLLFGIPDNEQVMAVISLGKRASDPRRPDRKPIDEIVKFY